MSWNWNRNLLCTVIPKGHNKRSCPSITERHLDQYNGYKRQRDLSSEGNDDTDMVLKCMRCHMGARARTAYVKRTGLDPDTGEKVKRKTGESRAHEEYHVWLLSGTGVTPGASARL